MKRVKYIALTVVAVVVAGSGIALWMHAAQPIPKITIPQRKMPSPNAYDYYVRAGQAIRSKVNYNDDNISLSDREAILKKDAKALKLLREGFSYQYMLPPVPNSAGSLPRVRIHHLAYVLRLEGYIYEMKSNFGGAMSSYLDAIKVGEDTTHGASF